MKIDGKAIAAKIYDELKERVAELRKQGITPKLAVILIGDDPGSVSYVAQKEKFAAKVGVELVIDKLPNSVSPEELTERVASYNAEPLIHGVIIQRPAPEQIKKDLLDTLVIPEKDVDGFHPNSDFAAPVALAVERILYVIYTLTEEHHERSEFPGWLMNKNIVVIGKGETAGTPIIEHFHGRDAHVTVIDSKTEDPLGILEYADVIISAVGKERILTPEVLHHTMILIGVGLHTEAGKLRGDYIDREVDGRVAFYTPTPGGVGPVNVAMLLGNVIRAAEEQSGNE